ncbi:MAG: isoprenylcysteine carboxylmethyltransferase family protein [Chitinophagales bacterium]
MKRIFFFLYGVLSYLFFFGTFLYLICFMGNFIVPSTIDGTPELPFFQALCINVILVLLFGIQHSGMARQSFKNWLTRYIPQFIERSTFVLISTIMLAVVMWFWQPMGGTIWEVEADSTLYYVLHGVSFLGWGILLLSTFLINHFELFGLQQVLEQLIGKKYTASTFKTPLFYKVVRHPLYLGFLIAFWATPSMTLTHLAMALGMTFYIFTGIKFEEKDLKQYFGETYHKYAQKVPMIIPFIK